MSGLLAADGIENTINYAPLIVAMGLAALAGLISFLSPCVLPLVPGYLSYVAGISGATATRQSATDSAADTDAGAPDAGAGATVTRTQPKRGRMLAGASLFVLGFTAVFVSFGGLFGGVAELLVTYQDIIYRVLGVVTIAMGVVFLGKFPWMQREWRVHRLPATGLAGAPLLGVVFGLGWTPCLGPTLAAVQTLAYTQGTAGRGAILSFAYCIGLGVPFLLIAFGAGWALRASTFARRHAGTIMKIGGIMLIVLGLLLVTGLWDYAMNELRSWFAGTGLGTTL